MKGSPVGGVNRACKSTSRGSYGLAYMPSVRISSSTGWKTLACAWDAVISKDWACIRCGVRVIVGAEVGGGRLVGVMVGGDGVTVTAGVACAGVGEAGGVGVVV